jgi:hypothetical protein
MGLRSLIWNIFRSFAHSMQMNRNFRCVTILPRMTQGLNNTLKQKFNIKLLSVSQNIAPKHKVGGSQMHCATQINKEGSRL